jgi:hypothetical protein
MVTVTDSRIRWPSENVSPGKLRIKGEAAFCDLGDNRALIAALAFEDRVWLHKLPNRVQESLDTSGMRKRPPIGKRIELPPDLTPILVTLSDVDDFKTMRQVYRDQALEAFGPGYSIEGVWMQMTNDSYRSFGIERKVPWSNATRNNVYVYRDAFKAIDLYVLDPFVKRF